MQSPFFGKAAVAAAVILSAAALLPHAAHAETITLGPPISQAVASVPGTRRLTFSGHGDRQSDTFPVTTGRVAVCWNVNGQSSSSLHLGPSVSISVESTGPAASFTSFDQDEVGHDCSYAYVDNGTYFLKVIATDWSNYTITVTSE
jgi:hypothetical protein